MPLQYLQFRPGVSRESTNLANSGGFYACDKIRFKSGMPQKIGGWARYVSGSSTTQEFLGVCRNISELVSLSGYYMLALGTNVKFYLLVGGEYFDITPLRLPLVSLAADPFYPIYGELDTSISSSDTSITVVDGTTFNFAVPYVITIGSEDIHVGSASGTSLTNCIRGYNGTTAASHTSGATITSTYIAVASTTSGTQVGDHVFFENAVAFGPYTTGDLNADFAVYGVSATYIIVDTGVQSTSDTNGGGASVDAGFLLTTGAEVTTFGNGWGAGPWGRGGWNTGYSGSGLTGFAEALRLWSSDAFGQNLVYNPRGGSIYYWDADTSLGPTGRVTGRGVDILDLAGADGYAPQYCNYVFVTDQNHIIALGGSQSPLIPGSALDPMMVQWSSQENPLVWDPADPTNTAGYQRLTYGSEIITAEKTRQEVLIFTDSAVYSMQYLGPPYIFGFNVLSNEITIASQNAVATASNITYWMGQNKFYVYSGRVDTLPCSLRQYIFDDFSLEQIDQVCCGTNERYNEIWWFYVSQTEADNAAAQGRNPVTDRYVIYNYLEKLWYYGQLSRTAWFDSHIVGNPIATSNNVTFAQEVGLDDGSTNPPTAISSYIQSADFDLGEGDQLSFVSRVIPDVDFIGSTNTTPSVTMTVTARNFPGQGLVIGSVDAPVPAAGAGATAQVYDYTNQIWVRLRGRQVAFRIESDAVGVQWQLGVPRLQIQPDGKKT